MWFPKGHTVGELGCGGLRAKLLGRSRCGAPRARFLRGRGVVPQGSDCWGSQGVVLGDAES